MARHPIRIEPARHSDTDDILAIDRAASELFRPTGLLSAEALGDVVAAALLREGVKAGLLDVARMEGGETAGFALASVRGGGLYLHQISVDPRFGRQGIGRLLMRRVERKAIARSLPHITLSTFRDLPWNASFYASEGYEEIDRADLAPFMLEIEEAQKPFMDVTRRVFMIKRLRKQSFRATRRA